ncbi:single-stranded DNA-binding protein [candidate division KSB3 bacterium]|uniref:Single-stranded DNA-binding protein n=1 Tax=candidate division KSB3 bacterium TaxID=2044937 RepID=A0A9D5Q6I0_9BACT|nr:single-stranded DNA-binding protein [candidate division KSB3 bacterium]MBD3325785.1 single-stranded DNA-binding protein [candidate division KSB3 bacterium]
MAGKSLNKVQIIGNLGADPELRYTSNGLAVATLNVATNERWKPSDSDEWQERTEWHRIVAWGKLAEIAGEYLAKGRQVYIEGRLQTRSWEDKDGIKRYTTEIVTRDLILLGGRGDGPSQSQRPPHPADSSSSAPSYTGPSSEDSSDVSSVDDDIPF